MTTPFPPMIADPAVNAPLIIAASKIVKRVAGLCPIFARPDPKPNDPDRIVYNVAAAGTLDDVLASKLPRPSAHVVWAEIASVSENPLDIGQGDYSIPTIETWSIYLLSSNLSDDRRQRAAPAQEQMLQMINQVNAAIIGWLPDNDEPRPRAKTRRVAQFERALPLDVDGEKLSAVFTLRFPNYIQKGQGYPQSAVDLSAIQITTVEGGDDHSHGTIIHTAPPPT